MSVELLRRAEALMRERAAAATAGPWVSRRGPGEHVVADLGVPHRVADTSTREDRRHIASWHPDVALAVADWLAGVIQAIETWERGIGTSPDQSHAYTVARAYLGEHA